MRRGVGAALSRRPGDEVIAAVVKVMSGDELSNVARKIFNLLPPAMASRSLAETPRLAHPPNSPGDDEEEILFSFF